MRPLILERHGAAKILEGQILKTINETDFHFHVLLQGRCKTQRENIIEILVNWLFISIFQNIVKLI